MAFHVFQINEVYSNADGSVQFIELLGGANGQNLFSGHDLSVTQGDDTHTFTIPSNLPSSATNGKTVLLATPGFQALTGVTPDYIIPANFLFTSGSQSINWAGADILNILALPTEGGLSVGQNGVTTAVNTPKNFAGVSGVVPFNHGPVSAELLDDAFTGVGQLFSLTVPANDFSDSDDDPLSYTATLANNAALPGWLTFDSNTLVLSGTPGGGDLGTIQVKITASDETASASDTFALTVIDGLVVNGDGAGNNLSGSADADVIQGFGGDDTLDGGAGNDTLIGGAGNDSYVIALGDTVSESSLGGIDTVLAAISYALGANLENLTLTGAADLDGAGNALANVITGNSGDNELTGGGHDTLAGGLGNDTYFMGHEDEVTEAPGEGHDTVVASVKVTLGDDVEDLVLASGLVFGGSGNALDNSLTGNRQTNFLSGGAGDDTLDGGSRGDAMAGGSGDDTYFVDSGQDLVIEAAAQGDDTVIAAVSFDLAAAAGVETLVLGGSASRGSGNALDNTIEGNGSANRLNGRAGDDTLIGAAGNDTLTGGAGGDQFYFDTLAGVDRILDFASGVDQLVFDGGVFTGTLDYDADTGKLSHDGQLIAVLEHAGELIPQDFVIL